MRRVRVRVLPAWVICGLALVGCNAVLGIEDLSSEGGDGSVMDEPEGDGGGRGGNAGRGGSAGEDGGTSGKDGGAGAGGAGGSSGMDAGTDSGTQDSGSDLGGDSGTDGGTDSGTQDSGPPSPDVHGKVIDYYRNPVQGVAVKIGTATATTDASGEFTIEDVADTYDVALTINAKHYGGNQVSGWLFVGLTRRDPTLQVYRGQQLVSGNIDIQVDGDGVFPLGSYDEIAIGFAGNGFGDTTTSTSSPLVHTSWSWEGPNSVSGTAHALRWSSADTAPHVPTVYDAADSQALSLSIESPTPPSLTLDLGDGTPLPTGLVSATVNANALATRTNAMFVRYTDNAAIQVAEVYDGTDTFSYSAPVIANTAIVVAATVNTPSYVPFAVAWSDDLTPGAPGVTLDVPAPPTLLGPGGNTTNVTADTLFTWTGTDQVFLFHVDNNDFLEGYYVVTAAKEARIPAPPITNLPLAAGSGYTWTVSTHMTHATVDSATGPNGFMDAYCYGAISGPQRGHGTHTESTALGFTTAP